MRMWRTARSMLILVLLLGSTALSVETGSQVGMKAPDFTLIGTQLDLRRGISSEIEVNLHEAIEESDALFLYFFYSAS